MTRLSCNECKFWRSSNGLDGECHRHAPRKPTVARLMRWPITDGDEFCGEGELEDDSSDGGEEPTR